jgi:hypothetical protein
MTRVGEHDAISQVLRLLAGGLVVGEPRASGSLTLVPLTGGAKAPLYLTAAQAFGRGTLRIEEVGGGQVPQLAVHNDDAHPVLLLDGEHLEGAMQNRVLNVSVLAAPKADTVIPVSCVEQGRWGYRAGRHGSAPSDDVAYAELRALKASQVAVAARAGAGRRVDQSAVWADIERKRAQVGGGASATHAMRDAYDDRRASLDGMLRAFPRPADDQTGVVAFAGARPIALDAFDRPSTLAAVWERLVRGYAIDAIGVPPASAPLDASAARGFLVDASEPDSDATAHEGVGLGTDVLVTSATTVAAGLTWDGGVVHLAVFPRVGDGRPATRPRPRADRIERPSARSRNRRDHFHSS